MRIFICIYIYLYVHVEHFREAFHDGTDYSMPSTVSNMLTVLVIYISYF